MLKCALAMLIADITTGPLAGMARASVTNALAGCCGENRQRRGASIAAGRVQHDCDRFAVACRHEMD